MSEFAVSTRARGFNWIQQSLSLILTLSLCAIAIACSPSPSTQRIVSGRTLVGRYISPDAYAVVLHAELLAASGDHAGAWVAYQEASKVAGYSPQVWTRLGALACQLKKTDYASAFNKAESLDHNYEPLWRARAECAMAQGRSHAALGAALKAASLDLSQARNSALVVQALNQLARSREAEQWQQAFALRSSLITLNALPVSDTQWNTLTTFHNSSDCEPDTEREALDAALLSDDLPRARVLAARLSIRPATLALHALDLGLLQAALEQGLFALAANPHDADARIVALACADLLRNETRFRALLLAPSPSSELSTAAQAQLLKLVARRTQGAEVGLGRGP